MCRCDGVKDQDNARGEKSGSDTDKWFCGEMLLIVRLTMKEATQLPPFDQNQRLPSAFSPFCLCFRPPSTTTSLSPSQMSCCRRKQSGRLTRWTQRPPLTCSGTSETCVDPLNDIISRNSEQIRLKAVCDVNVR